MELIEYTVPQHYLTALFYGDLSGLNDDEIKAYEAHQDHLEAEGLLGTPTGDYQNLGFCHSNDIDHLAGDCYSISYQPKTHL